MINAEYNWICLYERATGIEKVLLEELRSEYEDRERRAFEAGRRTEELEAGMGTRKVRHYETFEDYKREQEK